MGAAPNDRHPRMMARPRVVDGFYQLDSSNTNRSNKIRDRRF